MSHLNRLFSTLALLLLLELVLDNMKVANALLSLAARSPCVSVLSFCCLLCRLQKQPLQTCPPKKLKKVRFAATVEIREYERENPEKVMRPLPQYLLRPRAPAHELQVPNLPVLVEARQPLAFQSDSDVQEVREVLGTLARCSVRASAENVETLDFPVVTEARSPIELHRPVVRGIPRTRALRLSRLRPRSPVVAEAIDPQGELMHYMQPILCQARIARRVGDQAPLVTGARRAIDPQREHMHYMQPILCQTIVDGASGKSVERRRCSLASQFVKTSRKSFVFPNCTRPVGRGVRIAPLPPLLKASTEDFILEQRSRRPLPRPEARFTLFNQTQAEVGPLEL